MGAIKFETSEEDKKSLQMRIRKAAFNKRLRYMKFSVCLGDHCVNVIKITGGVEKAAPTPVVKDSLQ